MFTDGPALLRRTRRPLGAPASWPRPVSRRTAAVGAAVWAFVFAATSFYWALGGRMGAETLGPGLVELARDPLFVAVGLWGAGVAKAIGGLVALGLAAPGGAGRLEAPLRVLAIVGGGVALLYGSASLVQHVLMLAGAIRTPTALGGAAAAWHVVVWDPVWIVGGLLFLLAGRRRPPVLLAG